MHSTAACKPPQNAHFSHFANPRIKRHYLDGLLPQSDRRRVACPRTRLFFPPLAQSQSSFSHLSPSVSAPFRTARPALEKDRAVLRLTLVLVQVDTLETGRCIASFLKCRTALVFCTMMEVFAFRLSPSVPRRICRSYSRSLNVLWKCSFGGPTTTCFLPKTCLLY